MFKPSSAFVQALTLWLSVLVMSKRPHVSDAYVTRAKKTINLRRSLPHVSGSAFAAIIRHCQENNVSDVISHRTDLVRARNCSLDDTPFGPLLVKVTLFGTPPHANKDMLVVSPFAYLYLAFKGGGGFTKLIYDRLRVHPNSIDRPWRLALYADEVVPGNPLAVVNRRKVWVLYWSFLELHPLLHYENSWMPLIAEPAVGLKSVSSGISQVFAAVLKLFFGSHTFDFRNGLQLVDPHGHHIRFYARLEMFIQDGGAHKLVWGCKGDAGIRMCMLCKNVVSKASSLTDSDGTNLLVSSVVHERDCIFATDEEVRGAVRRIAGFKRTCSSKAEFALRQQAIGFTHLEHGLLQDPALEEIVRPVSQYCHDWMHGIFSGGLFNVAVFLFLEQLRKARPAFKPWERLSDYIKLWRWPNSNSLHFDPAKADLFSDSRVKSYKRAGHIKCSASQGLSVLPVIATWTATAIKPTGLCAEAARSVMALCDLVEALQSTIYGIVPVEHLRACVLTFLEACVDAGFRDAMIPKFHWSVHFSTHLEKFGTCLTCWVHERKHRWVKAYASDIANTSVYSKSVLSETVSHQLYTLSQDDSFDATVGLINPHKAHFKIRDFMRLGFNNPDIDVYASVNARIAPCTPIKTRDVLLVRSDAGYRAGQVWILTSVPGIGEFALCSMWPLRDADEALGLAVWRIVDVPELIPLSSLLCPVCWCESSVGFARTLIPYQFRGLKADTA
jgi:hypothetical protein